MTPSRETLPTFSKTHLRVGDRCRWQHQADRLVYLGYNWSGNGYWHQFEKVDKPGVVWCEVLESDIDRIELLQDDPPTAEEWVEVAIPLSPPLNQRVIPKAHVQQNKPKSSLAVAKKAAKARRKAQQAARRRK